MGVYIPPPNDNDSAKDDKNKRKKNKNNDIPNTNPNPDPSGDSKKINNVIKGVSSTSSPGSTTYYVPNPSTWIPHNPSAGLIWGPLTPSSDNRPALYGMVGLQFMLGLGFFRSARQLFRPRTIVTSMNSIPQHFTPKGSFWKASIPALTGAVAVYGCGLELSRLMLAYDPWYEEAKYYRRVAIKNGDKPSAWFGAYDYYKPMSTKAWIDKVGFWIKATEHEISDKQEVLDVSIVQANGSNPDDKGHLEKVLISVKKNTLMSQMNKKGKYVEIYNRLRESNKSRYRTLLDTDLQDVQELNKAERIDLILEGKSPYINPDYTKPHIQLGNHHVDTDDEFEMVWLNFEPWDELKLETDYDIRLIPHWRWADSDSSDQEQNSVEQQHNHSVSEAESSKELV